MTVPSMDDFTFKFVGQVDNLSTVYTPSELKTKFDSRGVELRAFINALVGILNSVTDGSSGADNIAVTTVSGLSGNTVQVLLEALKTAIDEAVLGQIPDNTLTTAKYQNGSITAAKCAADVATQAELDSLAGTGRTTETVKANADNIESHSNNTTTIHGATSEATASKLMIRDAAGRAKVVAPSAEDDIALKSNVTAVQGNIDAHLADYAHHYAADGGSTDDYAITPNPAISAYASGQTFNIKANTANTGAATLNISAKGAKTIKKNHNEDLVTGDIAAGQIFTVVYDAGDDTFQLTSGTETIINDASDTAKGIVELATAAEVTTGTSTTLAVTPAGVKVELDKKGLFAAGGYTGNGVANRAITVGFQPKVVYVWSGSNTNYCLRIDTTSGRSISAAFSPLSLAVATAGVALSSTGFVTGNTGSDTNSGNVDTQAYAWEAWA